MGSWARQCESITSVESYGACIWNDSKDRSCYTPWVNKFMLDYVNHVGPRRTIVQQLSDRGVAAEDVDTVLFRYAKKPHLRCID